MGLTAKARLHHRLRDDGTRRVQVRLTKDRTSAFLDAGFCVAPAQWNDKPTAHLRDAWVRQGAPNAEGRNQALRDLLNDAEATARRNPHLSAEQVRDLLARALGAPTPAPRTGGPPAELVAFARWYVAQRRLADKPNTVLFYHNTANDLAAWRGGAPLPLVELTTDHLDAFHAHLLARPDLYAGTARDRLVKLSTIVLRAQRLGLLPEAQNPFRRYRLPAVPNKHPAARPTEDAHRAVLALDLDAVPAPRLHDPAAWRRSLAVRRDVWHLQYLLRGTRIADVLQLRERDVRPDRLTFTESKTGKRKGTARTPALDAILARYPPTGHDLAYVLPLLDHRRPYAALHPDLPTLALLNTELRARTQYVNNGLRTLARLAGVPAFTSHSARHLFAERTYRKTKDLWLVKSLLQHSKIGTTEQYMKTLGHDELDAATAAILGDD